MITLVALLFLFSVCRAASIEDYVLYGPLLFRFAFNSDFCAKENLAAASFPDYATFEGAMNPQAKELKKIGLSLITVVDKNNKQKRFWWDNDIPYNKEFDSHINGAKTTGIYYHYADLQNEQVVIQSVEVKEAIGVNITSTICQEKNGTQPSGPKWVIQSVQAKEVTELDKVCKNDDAIVPNARALELLFEKGERINQKSVKEMYLPLKLQDKKITWRNGSPVEESVLSLVKSTETVNPAFLATFDPLEAGLSIKQVNYDTGSAPGDVFVLCTKNP